MSKFFTTFCFLGLAIALMVSSSIFAGEPKNLFDGANLDDWDFFLADPALEKSDVWQFKEGGILYCAGEPFGWLGTKEEYKNFHFTVEYRWPDGEKPSNSGVFLRIAGEPAVLPSCVECQLMAGKAGDLYGFGGRKIAGSSDRSEFRHSDAIGDYYAVNGFAKNEAAAHEWNKLEITAQDGTIIIILNGRLVNWSLTTDEVAGKLGLQSEGGPIKFRNPLLTVLP